ncbi:DsrE family protein [Desulfosarcina cetonica]|uniref:DsrE family protein n=1 Tax=Desulfosarcina cetonica TaxID=90730 RepID=UPI0006D17264|nr:DsrE family protein [Desulfosarcina cetonica]VTR65061.1 DsrE family protein [Desulfosarcina cetonica]
MSEKEEKILYLSTHGDENLDKACLPFVLANGALAMDVKATIILQANAVVFAKKGFAETVPASGGFPPMQKLLSDFIELGGTIQVCGPCIKERGITPEDLIDGAAVTAAGQVNIAALEADAVFVY